MEHKEAWKLLDEYRDGELDSVRTPLVRDHMKDCPACREALAGREALSLLISRATELRPSEGIIHRVREQIAESGLVPPKSAPLRWPIPAMAAVALTATILIAVGLVPLSAEQAQQGQNMFAVSEQDKGGPMQIIGQDEDFTQDQMLGLVLEES